MENFLNFRNFITPTAIKPFFWLGTAVIVIAYLSTIDQSHALLGTWGIILSLLFMVFGVFAWRVWCELVLVAFRIHDTLDAIRQNTVRS